MLKTFKPNVPMRGPAICIYGPNGAGKTSLLSTLDGPGLVVTFPEFEGSGYVVLSDEADRIDIFGVERWDQLDEVFRELGNGSSDYRWFAFDTFTNLTEIALRKILPEQSIEATPVLIDKQSWGEVSRRLGEALFRAMKLPQIKIFLAQEDFYESQDSKLPGFIGPATRPPMIHRLLDAMDIIGRLNAEDDGERRLLIGPSSIYRTKPRSPKSTGGELPAILVDPKLEEMIEFMYGAGPAPAGIAQVKKVFGKK